MSSILFLLESLEVTSGDAGSLGGSRDVVVVTAQHLFDVLFGESLEQLGTSLAIGETGTSEIFQ